MRTWPISESRLTFDDKFLESPAGSYLETVVTPGVRQGWLRLCGENNIAFLALVDFFCIANGGLSRCVIT